MQPPGFECVCYDATVPYIISSRNVNAGCKLGGDLGYNTCLIFSLYIFGGKNTDQIQPYTSFGN